MSRRGGAATASSDQGVKACIIRLQKDLEEIREMRNVNLTIPDPNNLQHFIIRLSAPTGLYRGAKFDFDFVIPDEWPTVAPQVTIITNIWHPNIQEVKDGGHVCVSVLRKAYTPTLLLSNVVGSLQFLLVEPNPNDALNTDAAQQWLTNFNSFKAKAEQYMADCPDSDDDDDD